MLAINNVHIAPTVQNILRFTANVLHVSKNKTKNSNECPQDHVYVPG